MAGPKKAFSSTIKDYCESTSLHGFAYCVSTRKIIERSFWTIIVLVAVAFSSINLKFTIDDWIASPSQTTINALGMTFR